MDQKAITAAVEAVLSGAVNLDDVTERSVRESIAGKFPQLNVKLHKKELKEIIRKVFVAEVAKRSDADVKQEVKDEDDEEVDVKSEESDSEDDEPNLQKKKKRKTSSSPAETDEEVAKRLSKELNGRKQRTRKASGAEKSGSKKIKVKRKKAVSADGEPPKKRENAAFMRPLILSPSLAEVCGAAELSRPHVVKSIWAYIKDNNLQDPADKRFIVCDKKLQAIFKKDRVHMMTMNKDLGLHLSKKEELVAPKTEVKTDA